MKEHKQSLKKLNSRHKRSREGRLQRRSTDEDGDEGESVSCSRQNRSSCWDCKMLHTLCFSQELSTHAQLDRKLETGECNMETCYIAERCADDRFRF